MMKGSCMQYLIYVHNALACSLSNWHTKKKNSFTTCHAQMHKHLLVCIHARLMQINYSLKGGFHRNHGKHATDGAMPNMTITTK